LRCNFDVSFPILGYLNRVKISWAWAIGGGAAAPAAPPLNTPLVRSSPGRDRTRNLSIANPTLYHITTSATFCLSLNRLDFRIIVDLLSDHTTLISLLKFLDKRPATMLSRYSLFGCILYTLSIYTTLRHLHFYGLPKFQQWTHNVLGQQWFNVTFLIVTAKVKSA